MSESSCSDKVQSLENVASDNRPSGAAATLHSQVSFIDLHTGVKVEKIDGRNSESDQKLRASLELGKVVYTPPDNKTKCSCSQKRNSKRSSANSAVTNATKNDTNEKQTGKKSSISILQYSPSTVIESASITKSTDKNQSELKKNRANDGCTCKNCPKKPNLDADLNESDSFTSCCCNLPVSKTNVSKKPEEKQDEFCESESSISCCCDTEISCDRNPESISLCPTTCSGVACDCSSIASESSASTESSCNCCHCAYTRNLGKSVNKKSRADSTRQELCFFLQKLLFDMQAFEVAQRDKLNAILTAKPPAHIKRDHPIDILSATEVGPSCIYIKWKNYDDNIDSIQVYVDGCIVNQYFSPKRECAVIHDVDPTKMHSICMVAKPKPPAIRSTMGSICDRLLGKHNEEQTHVWKPCKFVYVPDKIKCC